MSDKHGKISVFVYISILINIIVLALFITFVFGLKKDAFDVDTKKLDRNALICQNSIVSLVKDYDDRLNKIVESYPFINLLQQVILNGIDEAERDRIISIFRSGNYPFDTVALYLADGKSVFSSPVKTKPVDLESYKKSNARAFFDKDYDGVYFVKPIKNDRGIEVGYIVASVFKKIFENTSYNLNFVVLPNGVVYHNPSIDINSISRDSLTQYMDKDIGSSGTIDVDNNTFTFYSSKVKDIDNFSIGILELNVPIIQKYLKYIILALLALSSLFLITTSLLERNKVNEEEEEDNEEDKEDENIYDESEPPLHNYDNSNIVNDEEFNIDDYNIDSLDDDSIKYFNNKRDRITKANKVDLPDIDDVEDIEIKKDNEEDDESLKLDDVLEEDKKEDESIKIGDLSSLDDVLEDGGETVKDEEDNNEEDDESLKLGDLSSLDDVLEEDKKEDESIKIGDLSSLDGITNDEDFDEVPNLDDIINDEDNKEDNKDESMPEMKEYTDDELLDADNIVDDEDEDVPNLDDIINDEEDNNKEEDNKDESMPEMKEYTDDELLDSDNIIENDDTQDLDDNNIEDTIKNLDDIPNLNDELENKSEDNKNDEEDNNIEDTIENLDDIPNLNDELENKSEDDKNDEEDNNIEDTIENLDDIPNLNDELENKNEDNNKDDNTENMDDIPDNEENSDSIKDDEDKLEETVDNVDNNKNEDIIKGIDDIIDDNNEGDILISHGSILEDEIVKKEEEYFSSSDAFNFSLNRDFLLGDYDDEENSDNNNSNLSPNFREEYDDGEVVKPAGEKDTFDTDDLTDKDLYDPEEVPKIPDDFYREAEEKVKENMTAGWKNVLKSIRGKKFVNKNMHDMLNWIKEQSGLDIKHAAMLTRKDDGSYSINESQNISDATKDKLNINENEALFKKILSHKKTLYVSDPFSSDSLKNKFDVADRENISHMIFVPVENDEGGLKSFFIGLSSN